MSISSAFTPRHIVDELDKFIIGQGDAKRAVAIALRNRYRRERLPAELRDEVIPKNILMIGPTGVGKTEIARRLAKIADAPFLKVEATKYTEVGYVGRDVEAMVRDLAETAIRMVQAERVRAVAGEADALAVDRIVNLLKPRPRGEVPANPLSIILGGLGTAPPPEPEPAAPQEGEEEDREALRRRVTAGEMDDASVEVEVEEAAPSVIEVFSGAGMEEMGINFQDMLGGLLPRRKKKRTVSVADARKMLAHEEASRLVDHEAVKRDAIRKAEEGGIIFIDEMDKIAGREKGHGPDVSREGVQRDILPIVEGCTVMTKHGPVRTDHVLFIAAGAFHVSKPSDLIPELQGRFPIRVELTSLGQDDFVRILTEPENALVKQYEALLATEDVTLDFREDGIAEIARVAQVVNESTENIGARRLHTILERVLEVVSFEAPDRPGSTVVVDAAFVRGRLETVLQSEDLSRYIL